MAPGRISKPTLRKMLKSGLLEGRREGYYTDDYAGDAACNYRKTGWKPMVFLPDSNGFDENGPDSPFLVWKESDLNDAKAYRRGDGTIHAGPHWDSWTFREVETVAPRPSVYIVEVRGSVYEVESFDELRAAKVVMKLERLYGRLDKGDKPGEFFLEYDDYKRPPYHVNFCAIQTRLKA